jgi:hypothetical protein
MDKFGGESGSDKCVLSAQSLLLEPLHSIARVSIIAAVDYCSGLLTRSSVLDVTAKDYRKLIFENAISEFDFRKYVFARQSEVSATNSLSFCSFALTRVVDFAPQLRFMLHRPWDVASTAVLFIQMLSRDLKRKKLASEVRSVILLPHLVLFTLTLASSPSLPLFPQEARNFSISWVFSACLCVVEACQEAAKAMKFGDFAEKSQQPKELNPQVRFLYLSVAI